MCSKCCQILHNWSIKYPWRKQKILHWVLFKDIYEQFKCLSSTWALMCLVAKQCWGSCYLIHMMGFWPVNFLTVSSHLHTQLRCPIQPVHRRMVAPMAAAVISLLWDIPKAVLGSESRDVCLGALGHVKIVICRLGKLCLIVDFRSSQMCKDKQMFAKQTIHNKRSMHFWENCVDLGEVKIKSKCTNIIFRFIWLSISHNTFQFQP